MAKSKVHKGHKGDGRPRKDKDGRERIVHIDIAARRFAGGPTPSPEAYARAIEQWRRLNGAVTYVPVQDLVDLPEAPMPTDVDADAPPGSTKRRDEKS